MYLFIRQFLQKDREICNLDDKTKDGEDVEIGKCLRNLDVTAGDSRDGEQRDRFFPFPPEKHLHGKGNAWYHQATFYPTKQVKQEKCDIANINKMETAFSGLPVLCR